MSTFERALPSLCLLLLMGTVPFALACGGCPRAGRTSGGSDASDGPAEHAAAQEGARSRDPEHVILVDRPMTVTGANVTISAEPLTRETVQRVIESQSEDLARCYERARSEHPALSGTLVLELDIAASGHVIRANVVEDLGDGLLSGCFSDHARQWHFPESAHETTLRYPFTLGAAAES